MGLKIWWQDIFPDKIPFTKESEVIWGAMESYLQGLAFPGTEITFHKVQKSAPYNWYPFIEMLNNIHVVEGLIEADRSGYDASIIGCCCDPALYEARGVSSIPVIGLMESGLVLARTLGQKFAIVTVWDGYLPLLERRLKVYGALEWALARPVRHFSLDWNELVEAFRGNVEPLIKQFEAVALKCIEDGADVIINGCAYAGPALTAAGYRQVGNTGVPVVDCTTIGIKMAESLAFLNQNKYVKKGTSPLNAYAAPHRKHLDRVLADYNLARGKEGSE